MTDAPKRIWAWRFHPDKADKWVEGGWAQGGYRKSTEYIRADLVPRWQPIETAPRDGSGVLGWWPHWTAFPVRIWWLNNQWHMAESHPAIWHDDMPINEGPTHWRHLPEPPQ